MTSDKRYWIAINGAGCALASMPMRNPMVTPTPQQLIGFPTLEEAEEVQRICLKASLRKIRRLWEESLRSDVESGRIRVINPAHPQPPTSGPTMWTDSDDVMHALVQKAHLEEKE
jgi:hypothetical protein